MSGEAMKAKDLKPCKLCGKGMMHTGLPLFYRVTIERMGIDGREVQRTHGMEQFMGGNVAIARAFHTPNWPSRYTPASPCWCAKRAP